MTQGTYDTRDPNVTKEGAAARAIVCNKYNTTSMLSHFSTATRVQSFDDLIK